jgi:hypothetical protein
VSGAFVIQNLRGSEKGEVRKMGFFDTNNYTSTDHLNFRFAKIPEIAEKLNDYIATNRMDMIETFCKTFKFPEKNEIMNEWLFHYGGLEAIRTWRRFSKHGDIEKEYFPRAYAFKQECIYNLDNYETANNLTPENDSFPQDTQEAEIISVDIPTPPIERIANAVEQINNKIPETNKEILPSLEPLEKLTQGDSPVLRKWTDGKYKCNSLEDFVKAYIKIADNLTPALIRDYLISERTENPYTNSTIETNIKLHGMGR